MNYINTTVFLNKTDGDSNAEAQQNFYKELTGIYSQNYATFTPLFSSLNSQIESVIGAGADQYGYSDTEDAALRTNATNTDSAKFQNEGVALQNKLAQQSGGTTTLPSGASTQLQEQLAVSKAQTAASDQNAITTAGYEQGRTNYNNAIGEEQNMLSLINPNSYASSANSAGSNATSAISTANQNSWGSVLGGALGGVGSVVGGALAGGKLCWIAAELYGGWDDPRTVLVRHWLRTEFIKTWKGKAILSLYYILGRPTAFVLRHIPYLKRFFFPIFDEALAKAKESHD